MITEIDTDKIEEIRRKRTEKALKRCARIDKSIQRREEEIAQLEKEIEPFRNDTAFNTQPGSFPLRKRVLRKQEKIFKLMEEIKRFKEKKDNIMTYKTRVKGDAERAYEKKRQENDSIFSVGSRANHPIYGNGEIVKVNKKTYRFMTDSGYNVKVDKYSVRPIKATESL